MDTNWLFREQSRRNQIVRDSWQRFRPHRARVMDLLRTARRSSDDCLALLGAGNCNDIDLRELVESFREIHLLDIDPAAMAFGVEQQQLTGCPRIHCHGGHDFTGFADILAVPPPAGRSLNVAQRTSELEQHRVPLPIGPMNVAASLCTLTQLIEMLAQAWNPAWGDLPPAVLAIRNQHIQLLRETLLPGGRGLLISDFVSSDTCPELIHLSIADLPRAARGWIEQQNFFTGANPFAIQRHLLEQSQMQPKIERIELIKPWRWDLGPRSYAVSAVRFERSGDVSQRASSQEKKEE